jgi:hypothetical protein
MRRSGRFDVAAQSLCPLPSTFYNPTGPLSCQEDRDSVTRPRQARSLRDAGERDILESMPPIVTSNATILCVHGGKVTLIPKQMQVLAGGGPILCEPDLVGSPIVGCALVPSPSTKPCTAVVSTLPGSTSLKVVVGGRPAYVASLSGMTDGVPPGTIMVVDPGQTTVQA